MNRTEKSITDKTVKENRKADQQQVKMKTNTQRKLKRKKIEDQKKKMYRHVNRPTDNK